MEFPRINSYKAITEFYGLNGEVEKEAALARDNYSYKKYARELAKKKKKEDKLQRKLDKKNVKSDEKPVEASGEEAAH